jgi:hypothetical protein
MKKLVRSIALVLAAVMVFGMTVFASSPQTSTLQGTNQWLFDESQKLWYSVQAHGNDGVTVGPVSEDWLKRAREYAAANNLGEIYCVYDIRHNGAATVHFTTTFADANGTGYFMLHYTDPAWETNGYDAKYWEVIPVTNNNGVLEFTSASFSPFGFGKGAGAASVVAPKTGEVIAITVILAMILMAGAAVCAKKARLQK